MARRWPSTLLKCFGCLLVGVFIAALPTLYFREAYPGQYDSNTGISWFVDTAFFALLGLVVAFIGSFVVLAKSSGRTK
jgi:hypothetical protein